MSFGVPGAAGNAELRVHRAQLRGLRPSPAWNGTLASPAGHSSSGFASVATDSGAVVVVALGAADGTSTDSSVRVSKVLAPQGTATCDSPAQSWSSDGRWLAVAFGCVVAVYDAREEFEQRASFRLRYSAASIAISCLQESGDSGEKCELVVGTSLGAMRFQFDLAPESAEIQNGSTEPKTPTGSAYEDIAIGLVTTSSDGRFVALGSVDGRVFVRDLLAPVSSDEESGFGVEVLRRLLPSPRVTGLAFSPSNQELLAATRKGNVFIYSFQPATETWIWPVAVRHLAENPKSSSAAASSQTLASWWTSSVIALCSRTELSRIELLDVSSGKTLHILNFRADSRRGSLAAHGKGSNEWSEQPLVTGVCRFRDQLLCHDSSCSILAISWPFLAALER